MGQVMSFIRSNRSTNMPVLIWLEFKPSLITKCECDCEGLCVDCKDETKFVLSINRDFRTDVAEVIRMIRFLYGCKAPIRLFVQDHFVPGHRDISVLEDQFVVVKGSKIGPLNNNGRGGEAAAAGEDSVEYLENPNCPPSHDFLGRLDSKSDDSGMSSTEESDEHDYDDGILDTEFDKAASKCKGHEEERVKRSFMNEPSETRDKSGDRQSLKRPLNLDEEDEDNGSTRVKLPKTVHLQRGSISSTDGLYTRVSGLRKHPSLPAESGGCEVATAGTSARPVLSARRPSEAQCKADIKEMEIRNPGKIEAKPQIDQIPEGSAGSTMTDFTIDIPFLQFVSKMDSIPAVYPATGKKYRWDRKASYRHRDLASGRIIKFKPDAITLDRAALIQAKHSTLKSQGNSLNWIVQIGRWSKFLGHFMGQGILTDEVGTTLKKSLAYSFFLKPEDFWIVAEVADD